MLLIHVADLAAQMLAGVMAHNHAAAEAIGKTGLDLGVVQAVTADDADAGFMQAVDAAVQDGAHRLARQVVDGEADDR